MTYSTKRQPVWYTMSQWSIPSTWHCLTIEFFGAALLTWCSLKRWGWDSSKRLILWPVIRKKKHVFSEPVLDVQNEFSWFAKNVYSTHQPIFAYSIASLMQCQRIRSVKLDRSNVNHFDFAIRGIQCFGRGWHRARFLLEHLLPGAGPMPGAGIVWHFNKISWGFHKIS